MKTRRENVVKLSALSGSDTIPSEDLVSLSVEDSEIMAVVLEDSFSFVVSFHIRSPTNLKK